MRHSIQTDLLELVTDTHRADDGQLTIGDALAEDTATYVTVSRISRGDVILYPCWEGPTCTDQPRTVGAIVEYPETRVLYFREGGYGIADRVATVELIGTTDDGETTDPWADPEVSRLVDAERAAKGREW